MLTPTALATSALADPILYFIMHSVVTGRCPGLRNLVQTISACHLRSGLHSASSYDLPRSPRLRIEFGECSFTHDGPFVWNKLPSRSSENYSKVTFSSSAFNVCNFLPPCFVDICTAPMFFAGICALQTRDDHRNDNDDVALSTYEDIVAEAYFGLPP